MRVIHGIKALKKFRKPVVALGVFDGLHKGHRAILRYVVKTARRINGTSMAVTFWPHPQKEGVIYSLEHRLRLFSQLGIEACIIIGFNKKFSEISARDFINDILLKKIGVYYICVGKNFRFGRRAEGDFRLLNSLSKACGFRLKIFDVIKKNRQAVSSTYIRNLIRKGELKTAQRLLLRPVSVLGSVIKGSSLGRKLGFPTANINPHHEIMPPSGVYAVRVILNNKALEGICYIGTKPTLKPQCPRQHIEVHIFNFNKNIYGKYLEIQFIKKIRKEKKFSSISALAKQVKKDVFFTKKTFFPH